MASRMITVAAIQSSLGPDMAANIAKIEGFVREAAKNGAQVVQPPELFQSIYFPTRQDPKWFEMAKPVGEHPSVRALQELARELKIVIPISFFEKDGPRYYNSVAIADADGEILGIYRKSHIPDGPGYQEKYYFRPGDTGFQAWKTKAGVIGVGICWDQWFPECARAMALQGAELLLYPTAIGSEPPSPGYDSSTHWQNTMRGHAAANIVPLAASNRVGKETAPDGRWDQFYGRSFISDWQGEKVTEMDRNEEGVRLHNFDLDAVGELRRSWGVFRDRRPELYSALLTIDGRTRHTAS